MQKSQRKSEKKANKEGIKIFCGSLKKQMLYANKKGKSVSIHISQYPKEIMPAVESGGYIEFAEGDRMITVMLE